MLPVSPPVNKIFTELNAHGRSVFARIAIRVPEVQTALTNVRIGMIFAPSNEAMSNIVAASRMIEDDFAVSPIGRLIITNHFTESLYDKNLQAVPAINKSIISLGEAYMGRSGVLGAEKSIQYSPYVIVLIKQAIISQAQIDVLQRLHVAGIVATPTEPKPIVAQTMVTGDAFMAQIICGQLSIGPRWKDILSSNHCTTKGHAIAQSLIKIASTRIFSVPEQSIMEPIVNSLDSYNPTRKVGKFGMGFFSLMYWVVRDPNASMSITSHYRQSPTDKIRGYSAVITNRKGDLYVHVTEESALDAQQTGFAVRIYFGSLISEEILNGFKKQMQRLIYIDNVNIIFNGKFLNPDIVTTAKGEHITVKLSNFTLEVEDKAAGVPLEVFYSSLIVPSISSKTIILSDRKDLGYVDKSRAYMISVDGEESVYSSFKILVGDIVVVNVTMEDRLYSRSRRDFLLTLPMNTRVPVSRDDVLLDSVREQVFISLEKLLKASIDQFQDTTALENGLNAFIAETASSENVAIINEFLDSIPLRLERMGLVGVEPFVAVFHTWNQISRDLARTQIYVSTLNPDIARLENYLSLMPSSTEFFLNRRVIMVDYGKSRTIEAEAGGTTSYIFVNTNYIKGKPDWPVRLATEYKLNILYPVGTTFADSLAKPILNVLKNIKNERHRKLLGTLAGKYQSALNFREPRMTGGAISINTYLTGNIPDLLNHLWLKQSSLMVESDFEKYLSSIIAMLSACEPKVAAYGTALTIQIIPGDTDLKILADLFQTTPLQSFNMGSLFKSMLFGNYSKDPADPTTAEFKRVIATYPRNLFEKASRYQFSVIQETANAAKRYDYLADANITPFATFYELNIPIEIFYLYNLKTRMPQLQALNSKTADSVGLDIFVTNAILTFFEISDTPYQFLVGYMVLYRLIVLSSPRKDMVRGMLGRLRSVVSPLQFATYLKSLLLREFGKSIHTKFSFQFFFLTVGFYECIVRENQFKHLYFAMFKLVDDIYAWMEKQLKVSSLVQEVAVGVPDAVVGCHNFTLSQMIAYVFQHELPTTADELFSKISQFTSTVESKLQIIAIAVSEGSSKAEIPAKLTETVQNSLDAVRTNLAKGTIPNAQIQLSVKKLRGTNDLLLGISDPVGIPFSGIVALSIPFLSDKTPSELVTGEIGSGFFNVYRGASKVSITTTFKGQTITMIDTPILDPSNNTRILDIQRCAIVMPTPTRPNGTTILIQSKHTNDDLTTTAIDAITFCRDTIGLINDAQSITLNDEPISIPLTKIFENEYFEFHMATQSFTSYIMTKGVPFAPLHNYMTSLGLFSKFPWLLDQYRMNVRLNVKSGVFTPVQTRTKIGLSARNTDILAGSMVEAIFFVILYRIHHKLIDAKEIDAYLQYYSSPSDAGQVMPSLGDNQRWYDFLNYFHMLSLPDGILEIPRDILMDALAKTSNPFMFLPFSKKLLEEGSAEVPNFYNLLRAAKMVWPNDLEIAGVLTKILRDYDLDVSIFPGSEILKLAYNWITNKKKTVRPEEPKPIIGVTTIPNKPKSGRSTYMKERTHLNFCKVWIATYYQLAKQIIPNYPDGAPSVQPNYEMDSGTIAMYTPGANIITLYYEYIEGQPTKGVVNGNFKDYKHAMNHVIEVISSAKDLNGAILDMEMTNPIWRSHFMPKGTIAHEMEHFRSRDDHSKGSHSDITMNLPYGGQKKRIFMMQHVDTMMSLVQKGFYDLVRKEWLASLAPR